MAKKREKRYSGIGGQAVLEGIMMKNKERYAVAVRKPDGEIAVDVQEYRGVAGDSGFAKLPFIRGVFSFVDSLVLGTKTLNYSASFYEEETEEPTKFDKAVDKILGKHAEGFLVGFTTLISVILAVGIFMILPFYLSEFLSTYVRNASLMAVFEGILRILIFVVYILLISLTKDIKRVFMYHGAEHKCINCIEKGRPLTVKDVMRSSRLHKRCGTSFLLFVMLVSVILFFFIRVENHLLKFSLRIVLIPVIAGISYELIRLAGKHDNIFVNLISAPGMWLQKLTTKEPTEDMVAVAIAAVEAVFDWRMYLKDTFGYEVDDSWMRDEDAPIPEEDDDYYLDEEDEEV